MSRRLFSLCLLAVLALGAPVARAAELVMFERAGCIWCARWNAEIAPAYDRTDEGKRAALRRVDVAKPLPEDLKAVGPVVYTPNFVLVQAGKEIGRIEGFSDEAFFYGYLDRLLEKLEPAR